MLKRGDLDAVVLALPTNEDGLRELPLFSEPFLFAVSKQHPKAKKQSVSLKDLENEEVLLLEDGHCLRDQALDVCNTHRAVENTNFRATSLETLRQMVAANAGITLMPLLAAGNRSGAVSYIPFKGTPPHRDVGLCWRATSTRTELLEELGEVFKTAVGKLY
jgi:LysR family hydrogen peroxide-inducible transcriptional activator